MKKLEYNLELRLTELNQMIKGLEKRIALAPEGFILPKNGYFYRRIDNKIEYLGKDKEALIKALIQKKYDLGQLEAAQKEKQVLEKALKDFSCITKPKFPDQLMKYVTLQEYTDEAKIKEWSKPSESFIPRKIVDTQYYTLRGERVRSKSEIIIADRLFHAGVPYHFEKELDLIDDNKNWIQLLPDFTVLSLKTYETYYWEHFGWLDKEQYRNDMIAKLETYAQNGIFPGKNLIVTFETKDNQLSSMHVMQLINEYLKK